MTKLWFAIIMSVSIALQFIPGQVEQSVEGEWSPEDEACTEWDDVTVRNQDTVRNSDNDFKYPLQNVTTENDCNTW